MLASMPSSGSDFVADALCKAHPHFSYWREFFSPICNLKHSSTLMRLGDTLACTTENLCKTLPDETLEEIVASTWDTEAADFTKENYLAWNLRWFASQFRVLILLRRPEDTFPPTRHRVMRWYEHMAYSAQLNGCLPASIAKQCFSPMRKAICGHTVFIEKMLLQADELNLPVLWYDELISGLPQNDIVNDSFIEIINQDYAPTRRADVSFHDAWSDSLAFGNRVTNQIRNAVYEHHNW
jgi:hypothetical protein